MEDMMFKYSVVIVGVVIVVILMGFAMKSIQSTIVVPDEIEQSMEGDKSDVIYRIEALCEMCVSTNIDKDCFFLEATFNGGTIVQDDLIEGITLEQDVEEGSRLLKILNNNGCSVRKLK